MADRVAPRVISAGLCSLKTLVEKHGMASVLAKANAGEVVLYGWDSHHAPTGPRQPIPRAIDVLYPIELPDSIDADNALCVGIDVVGDDRETHCVPHVYYEIVALQHEVNRVWPASDKPAPKLGRPSSMDHILKEHARRVRAGENADTRAREAAALCSWWAGARQPEDPPVTQHTIENRLPRLPKS